MLTVLVGHRGVGKTSFLKRISRYVPEAQCFCLDSEIEKRHGAIQNIFSTQGEVGFRAVEDQVFRELVQKVANSTQPVYMAVGGGFQAELPQDAEVLWLQRDWDVSKNIFFDRPSLNPNPQELRIPSDLFQRRSERWEKQGLNVLTLPEGVYDSHPGEASYFQKQLTGGALTLLAHHFAGKRLSALKDLQLQYVELRDDLLSPSQISQAIDVFGKENTLLSFRDPEQEAATAQYVSRVALVDWPVERGEVLHTMRPQQKISSLHSEEENYYEALEFAEGFSEGTLKWSPFVKSFLQLRLGHEWQKRAPAQRIFLPRSENGRWHWYRHLQKKNLKINFLRLDFGSSLDQPTLLQWLQPTSQKFAAVLGQPVLQSWSPSFHADFFAQKNTSLYSIDVDEQELAEGGFEFLQDLGLCWAAVTSPLKPWAGKLVGASGPLNTLWKNPSSSRWEGASTDEVGFRSLLQKNNLHLEQQRVAIWGGGGVLPALNLPQAVVYSARTGFPREGEPMLREVDALVWAAGDQSTNTVPKDWKPKFVIDLNYRADSPARAYAHTVGAKYISGEEMFFKQAQEQQKIWSSYE